MKETTPNYTKSGDLHYLIFKHLQELQIKPEEYLLEDLTYLLLGLVMLFNI
jgi:hypothetical protein